jgi:hypothetical protein
MKLIFTYCIRFIVTWDSLRFFIIREADYKRKLPRYNKSYTKRQN